MLWRVDNYLNVDHRKSHKWSLHVLKIETSYVVEVWFVDSPLLGLQVHSEQSHDCALLKLSWR